MSKETIKKLSVFEYAKLHNTTPHTVYRWIREGKIAADKVVDEKVTVTRKRILV